MNVCMCIQAWPFDIRWAMDVPSLGEHYFFCSQYSLIVLRTISKTSHFPLCVDCLPFPSAWSTKHKGKSVPSVSSTLVSHSSRHVLSWSCISLRCFWEQSGWNAKERKLLRFFFSTNHILMFLILFRLNVLCICYWWLNSSYKVLQIQSRSWSMELIGAEWDKMPMQKERRWKNGMRSMPFSLISTHFPLNQPFYLPIAERQHWILRWKTRIFTNKS